ncbi:MAG: 3-dehydroquinate synthase [Alphaproteobacteria bacterium]|nr:3-dehydroquinate synthase [Alphaproteobacteria bacterium]
MIVPVDLGDRSYEIAIGPGLLRDAGKLIGAHLPRKKTAIVTDHNVAEAHLADLLASLEAEQIEAAVLQLPAGESTKSQAHLFEVTDFLLEAGIERNDVIVAFGGGVIGDLAGFAAAILRRGVNFIQVPTSLLAQVDSSVGGKTGINASAGKNLIGAFHQPLLVLADTAVLDSLPERQLKAGYAEVAKYGLLGDAGFFSWLEDNSTSLFAGDMQARMRAVETSCRAKAAIVAEDEREGSVRALLNLGHTFGHALEAVTGYSDQLLHGEGVAIGMAMAYRFSERMGVCKAGCADRAAQHLRSVGLPTHVRDVPGEPLEAQSLLTAMYQDKKATGGKLVFILARDIGDTYVAHDVSPDDVLAFLEDELAAA